MPLELRFLPAEDGDAIWVRWGEDLEYQLLVDMGPQATGEAIRSRIEKLPSKERHFELLVITHVDRDHIGGVLSGVAEASSLDGLSFSDVWFNGWAHLHGAQVPAPGQGKGFEPMGPAQGERLTNWLTLPWNESFDRGAVALEKPPRMVPLDGEMHVTVLGPTIQRLADFQTEWRKAVEREIDQMGIDEDELDQDELDEDDDSSGPILQAMGARPRPTRPDLSRHDKLVGLAETTSQPDSSKSNATSITLLLEWRGRRILLTGDAHADDLVAALSALDRTEPLPVDVVKLPHHGSVKNVTAELVKAVTCRRWVFSSNGARHYHPDAAAVARVLVNAPGSLIGFNVPSEYNEWWGDDTWQRDFEYTCETGPADEGLTITFGADDEPRPV